MQLKFKLFVVCICTYFFQVMIFLLSVILILIIINLTSNSEPEMMIPLFSICQIKKFLNLGNQCGKPI